MIKIDDAAFNANNLAVVQTCGGAVCVAKYGGGYHAFYDKCPHANGKLHEGYIDAKGQVVCPLHFYKFDMETGRMQGHDDCRLKLVKIFKNEDGWYIDEA